MTLDLFSELPSPQPTREQLAPQTWLLRSRIVSVSGQLLADIDKQTQLAPFRCMTVPGGKRMSVGLSNCGAYGWVSDLHGYRYEPTNPETQGPWPAMPSWWSELACTLAQEAGFEDFAPDVGLVNEYLVGTKMGLHQDKDEKDFSQPIVSLSLGLPAVFQFGGLRRSDPIQKVVLNHGDVLVWGGVDRLRYHGVGTIKGGSHPLTGSRRINITFRRSQ